MLGQPLPEFGVDRGTGEGALEAAVEPAEPRHPVGERRVALSVDPPAREPVERAVQHLLLLDVVLDHEAIGGERVIDSEEPEDLPERPWPVAMKVLLGNHQYLRRGEVTEVLIELHRVSAEQDVVALPEAVGREELRDRLPYVAATRIV